jgi:siderophore ferric iron reductase
MATYQARELALGRARTRAIDVTGRNYLFAASQDDVALTRFIATAAKVTGFLSGGPGRPLPGWHYPGQDNSAFVAELYGRLRANYPKARRPFHATRLWNSLIWQPVYLAAIAVHVHGALPDLGGLSQSRQNLDVTGYRLQPGPQVSGTVEEMIAVAGPKLRAMADVMLAEINAVGPLKRPPAMHLLADRVLTVMAALPRYRADISPDDQHRFCGLWLDAMGLAGLGALETLDLPGGQKAVVIDRQGCCLDYLAMPDAYCVSCPRQDDEVRRERQLQTAIAELDDAGA